MIFIFISNTSIDIFFFFFFYVLSHFVLFRAFFFVLLQLQFLSLVIFMLLRLSALCLRLILSQQMRRTRIVTNVKTVHNTQRYLNNFTFFLSTGAPFSLTKSIRSMVSAVVRLSLHSLQWHCHGARICW